MRRPPCSTLTAPLFPYPTLFRSRHPVGNPPIDFHPAPRPSMPTFALWSAHDGVVAVASARGLPHESDRQVEVDCGHMGFAYAPTSVAAIARALTEEIGRSEEHTSELQSLMSTSYAVICLTNKHQIT